MSKVPLRRYPASPLPLEDKILTRHVDSQKPEYTVLIWKIQSIRDCTTKILKGLGYTGALLQHYLTVSRLFVMKLGRC